MAVTMKSVPSVAPSATVTTLQSLAMASPECQRPHVDR